MESSRPDVTPVVVAAAQGSEEAWYEIVERYTPLLIGVLLRFQLSQAELQDLAQTVWLRLVEHLDTLREPRALPMWIITTAQREARRSVRESARCRLQDPLDERWSSSMATYDQPEAEMERADRTAALLEGLAYLTPRQRELLMLLAQDPPLSYAEISDRTGVPVGAIGPTRARALERLRRTPSVQSLTTPSPASVPGSGERRRS